MSCINLAMGGVLTGLLVCSFACDSTDDDDSGSGASSAGDGGATDSGGGSSSGGEDAGGGGSGAPVGGFDPALFFEGALTGDVTEEPCALANGTETTCYRFEIAGAPSNHELGEVCPSTITDGPEEGGLWSVEGELLAVDGPFIENLATLYDDEGWQMFDPDTGEVMVTVGAEECDAAGGLPPNPDFANFCVECFFEEESGPVQIEYMIPKNPVLADSITELDNIPPGVGLNGVRIEFPAALDIILSTFNLAPVDSCGGHVNNAIGYHYHEELGCIEGVPEADGHAALIGVAVDGFAIHEMNDEDGNEPDDLDECRGHSDDERGFHYHAASPGENSFIGCLRGELVEGQNGGGGPPGGGPGGGPPGGGG